MSRYVVTGCRESMSVPQVLLDTDDRERAHDYLRWLQREALGLTHYRILDHEPTARDCPVRVHPIRETNR